MILSVHASFMVKLLDFSIIIWHFRPTLKHAWFIWILLWIVFDEQERDGIHDKVCVYTRNGDEFIGDYALIAVPVGVLHKNVIEVIPDLPVCKQESIAEMGFGNLNKMILLFPYKFWSDDIYTSEKNGIHDCALQR